MNKNALALAALVKIYEGRLLRLGGTNGPMVRVLRVSLDPARSGLIDVCIVDSDGNERVVPLASLFDAE